MGMGRVALAASRNPMVATTKKYVVTDRVSHGPEAPHTSRIALRLAWARPGGVPSGVPAARDRGAMDGEEGAKNMERLSGLDASFLYFETPRVHTHVVA